MNKRILLVDCSPKLRQATRDKLEAAGFSVSLATTGSDVSTALEEERFDLVLLEPVVPGMDGFKFCQTIKRDMGSSAPLVVLASRIFRGGRLRTMSRDAGADAHFERPQQDKQLFETLSELLVQTGDVAATALSAGEDESLLSEVVELPAAGSGETEDSLTAMVPEPAFVAEELGAAEAASPSPSPVTPPAPAEPPGFDDLSAPQAMAQPATKSGAGDELDLPIELSAGQPEEDEDSGLEAISEEDIDDALARALGADEGGGELVGTVFPDDLANGLEPPSPAADQHKAVDSPVAFLEDVDPQSKTPSAPERPSRDVASLDDEEFALLDLDDGESESDIPRRATAAPQVAPQVARKVEPEPVSDATADPATGASEADPGADALVKSPGELDALLERAFGGEGASPAGEASTSTSAESADEPPPVPESLQGMDASTADLLSSLAELETSIPGAASGQAWQSEAHAEHLASEDPSLPVPPPPSPEEELTLEEIFSRVSSDEAPAAPQAAPVEARVAEIRQDPPATSEPVAASASAKVAEVAEVPEAAELVEAKPKRRGWRKWLLGSLVLVALALGVASFGLLRQSTGAAETQPAAGPLTTAPEPAASEPGVGPTEPEEAAEDTPLATLRRSVDETIDESPIEESAVEEIASARPPAPLPVPERPRLTEAALQGALNEPAQEGPVEEEVAAPRTEEVEGPSAERVEAPRAERVEAPQTEDVAVLLVPLGDLDEPLERVEAPAPAPTRAAIDAGVRARAFINVLVGSDGKVKTARTMMDPGYGLGEVARQATLGWRYSEPRYEGAPAEVWKTEAVEFDVKNAGRR